MTPAQASRRRQVYETEIRRRDVTRSPRLQPPESQGTRISKPGDPGDAGDEDGWRS
jgi:hypothetical protein